MKQIQNHLPIKVNQYFLKLKKKKHIAFAGEFAMSMEYSYTGREW